VAPGEDVYCSLEDAKASFGQQGTIFWDTRRPDEYDGSLAPSATTPRPGHIPDAVHLDWVELLDPESRTVKPAVELHALLGSRGITSESVINCY
jgi:3-mercaptopyruvate sulfurtransferase SseA